MNVQHTILKTETAEFDLKTGLDGDYRLQMSETLADVLAASYSLTIKSQIYHWNVVGPLFKPIHELTEEHYNDLFKAIDIIAERIRALGHLTPNLANLNKKIGEDQVDGGELTPEEMIKDLVNSHEKTVRLMRGAVEIAGNASDVVTEDMLTERLSFHEQAIWMLRSTIAK